jgi:hypothetical protein
MTYTFKLARRMATNHVARVVPLALVAVLAACGGAASPTDPTPTPTPNPQPAAQAGWLTIEFATPRADDGAVQFGISGPGIDSVRAMTPFQGVGGTVNTNTAFMVVTGTLRSGAIARIHVPDIGRAAQYQATVQAVAQKSSYQLQATAGYGMAVTR